MSDENWLITGIEGFVGSHFFPLLQKKGYAVFGTTWKKELADNKNTFYLDLSQKEEIYILINKIRPRYIALIAGFSSMRDSFEKSRECISINYESTRHFLEAIRKNELKIILGDNRRIMNDTTWRPTIHFEQTAYDTYLYWQEEIRSEE